MKNKQLQFLFINPTNQTKISNPDNLPIIEENSLHRIVTTVKLYQEFKELGQEKFEEIYGKADPKSLEGVCYKKYYEGKGEGERFGLVKNSPLEGWQAKPDGVFLELGDYLKVDLGEDKNVTAIRSLKPFYWKEWSFEEDIEREDWSQNTASILKKFGYKKNKKYLKDVNTFNLKQISEKDLYKKDYHLFVNYEFAIKFNLKHLYINVQNSSLRRRAYFWNSLNFNKATISANFNYSHFNCIVTFLQTNFVHNADFSKCIFKSKVDFGYASLDTVLNFSYSNFYGETSLAEIKTSENIDISHIYAVGNFGLYLKNIYKKSIVIDISYSTFDGIMFFQLDNKKLYKSTKLNFYHTSFSEFICDSRNINQIKLSKTEELKTRKDKKIVEQAIQERRVFRKILQDLHWGDYADEEYAKIMDLQLGLKKPIPRFFEWLFFSWWLGWGVRILTWKFWQGGIIWSSILLAILAFFALANKAWLDSLIVLTKDSNFLRSLNLIFTSDATSFTEILFVILGFIQLNLFLVILARKFMRM